MPLLAVVQDCGHSHVGRSFGVYGFKHKARGQTHQSNYVPFQAQF